MNRTNDDHARKTRPIREICHHTKRDYKYVTITLFRPDDLSFLLFLFCSLSLSCTILRPESTTPRIACDSKSPMTDWLGPLVRPRSPVRYLADSRAWPSPLWAYNTFSYVLSLSPRLTMSFYSILFHSATPLSSYVSILFHSILFDLFPRYSSRFYVSFVISESRCI